MLLKSRGLSSASVRCICISFIMFELILSYDALRLNMKWKTRRKIIDRLTIQNIGTNTRNNTITMMFV